MKLFIFQKVWFKRNPKRHGIHDEKWELFEVRNNKVLFRLVVDDAIIAIYEVEKDDIHKHFIPIGGVVKKKRTRKKK